ncbi:hypothetical protein ACQKWADRAFT_281210 [Trichoderma austrokoningii]
MDANLDPALPATRARARPVSRGGGRHKSLDLEPHRILMMQRVERVRKEDVIFPACDRCRRLHMPCIKQHQLSCKGCTKRHAKCSWRDVTKDEAAIVTAQMESLEREYNKQRAAAIAQAEASNNASAGSASAGPGPAWDLALGPLPVATAVSPTFNFASAPSSPATLEPASSPTMDNTWIDISAILSPPDDDEPQGSHPH